MKIELPAQSLPMLVIYLLTHSPPLILTFNYFIKACYFTGLDTAKTTHNTPANMHNPRIKEMTFMPLSINVPPYFFLNILLKQNINIEIIIDHEKIMNIQPLSFIGLPPINILHPLNDIMTKITAYILLGGA